MKALIYKEPYRMELENIPMPCVGAGEVLIRVSFCGICGSDVHGYMGVSGRRNPGVVMGHEFSGRVEEIGSGVSSVKVGDRVTAFPLIFCGECSMCKKGLENLCENRSFLGVFSRNGAMAEYVSVPEKCIVPLPYDLPDIYGAIIEPYAVGYRAVQRAKIAPGSSLLIVGAGTIGQMALINALEKEPRGILVSDLSDERLALARKLGAMTVNPKHEDIGEAIQKAFGEDVVDTVIEAVGVSATIEQAINALRAGGICVCIGNTQIGPSLPMQKVVTSELELRGTHIYTLKEFRDVVKVLRERQNVLENLVSCVCTPEEGSTYVHALATGEDRLIKVLIDFNSF